MTKDRRLGRGLAALLGTPEEGELAEGPSMHVEGPMPDGQPPALEHGAAAGDSPHGVESAASEASPPELGGNILHLNVQEIEENPFQPRRDFSESEISSLAESLREHDMLQPVLVRRVEDRFQLISGERRLRAAVQAGWQTIPARVREADDRLVAELAIVENLQRKDLNPVEKALSFKRYLDQHQCPQEDLAGRLKIDRSTIANLLRLLELPEAVQQALQTGALTAGHARALLPLGDERLQVEFSQRIRQEGMSVRETERQVQERIRQEDGEPSEDAGKRGRTQNPQIASLEQQLRTALGTKTDIRQSSRGRGKIVVHFSNHEEFERLYALLTDDAQAVLPLRQAG